MFQPLQREIGDNEGGRTCLVSLELEISHPDLHLFTSLAEGLLSQIFFPLPPWEGI